MRKLTILSLVLTLFIAVSCKPVKHEIPSCKEELVVKHLDWTKNAVIYEVNVRQYTKEGTFNAFAKSLPRLKDMGVDILWIMPIHPIGEKDRKMPLGSYYAVQNYLEVGKDYGTIDDFKALVKQAHQLGMHVIIDWVANHTAWDNVWITEHPDWYTKDSTGKIIAPVKDWTDVADLNYDNMDMRMAMLEALKYWVKETDIDGYRCDVADNVPSDFWNYVRRELDKIKPVFMLAECDKAELHRNGFDMSYCWTYMGGAYDIAAGKKTADYIDTLLLKETTAFKSDDYKMRFTTNHDENSWKGFDKEIYGDNFKGFALLSFTLPGMPMIYGGQEAGLAKRLKFFEKDPISWDDLSLADFYKSLIKLKKENKALWNGDFGGKIERSNTSNDKAVYAFTRVKDANKLLVVVNLSKETQKISLKGNVEGNYKEYFTAKATSLKADDQIELKPSEYLVFVK